jgi:serine/threonine-protein kinase RsbW
VRDFDRRIFKADRTELRPMSAWWREWAGRAGLDEERVYAGELCLNEAAGNIVVHGGDAGGVAVEVSITLECLEKQVRITLADNGPAFSPLRHPPKPPPRTLDETPIGGLGIDLLRRYAKEIHYRFEDRRNILTVVVDR